MNHFASMPRLIRVAAIACYVSLAAPGSGCGDAESTESTPAGVVSGTFNGQFLIQNTAPPVGGTMTFTVGEDGSFTGQTASTNPETMGEVGILDGTLTGTDPLSLDLDVTLTSPSGTFQLTGKCLYDEGTATLNAPALTAKDENGAFVGSAPFTATEE